MKPSGHKNGARKPAGAPGPPARLARRYAAFFALGMVAMASWQFIWPALRGRGAAVQGNGAGPGPAVTGSPMNSAKPWGSLECTEVKLVRPDEAFPSTPPERQKIQWFFKDRTPAQLAALVQSCDLTAEQKAALLAPGRCEAGSQGCVLTPPLEVLRDMSAAARGKLYAVLAESELNPYQQHPFRFHPGDLEECLTENKLAPETTKLIRKLAYFDRGVMCFANSHVLEHFLAVDELRTAARALSHNTTFIMKLRVNTDSDIPALEKYWGQGGRGDAIKPMLESMAKTPGGASISVAFFLPPFPRLRLHTYPNPALDKSPKPPDCFWTAMNFFNTEPDQGFFDPAYLQRTLKTQYERVRGDWAFGDVLLFVQDGDKALHMCVYVADDVVFTKNGSDPLQPWVLNRLPEMLAQYPSDKPLQVRGYRRKPI